MRTFPLTVLLAAALVAGCATTQPTGNIQNTVALIDATVPLAVAVAVSHDTDTVPKFQLAAALIDTAAGTQPADPTALVNLIRGLGMKPEAELAVLGGVALWQAYLAQHPDALPADTKLLLQTVAKDIREGLPPATPDSLRKAGKGKRR